MLVRLAEQPRHDARPNNEFTGVLTGKGLEYGGSLIRTDPGS